MIVLHEFTANQLIRKSRESKKFSRYENRVKVNKISVLRVGLLDIKEGSKDLNLYFMVNSATNPSVKYRVDFRLVDFVDHLREYAYTLDTNVTIKRLIRDIRPFFNQEIKGADIMINCSCPDFTYRFRDSARNEKFYFGIDSSDEARSPNSNKINPKYEGSVCKHIMKIISRPSLWYERVLRSLSNLLKNHNSVLVKKLDIPYG